MFTFEINLRDLGFFAGFGWHQFILLGGDARPPAVHLEVPRRNQNFSGGQKRILTYARDPAGIFKLSRRIKDRHKTPQHEVVNLLLLLLQPRAWNLACGDDRKVIADFGVVENPLIRLHPILIQNLAGRRDYFRRQRGARVGLGKSAQITAHGAEIIFRQTFGIRSRIGQQFVPLIKRLRNGQRVAGTETKPAAGFALQRGEIIQLRRRLLARLFGFLNDSRLAGAPVHHRLRLGLGPNPLGPRLIVAFRLGKIFTEPAPIISACVDFEFRVHLPVIARHKIANGALAFTKDCQGRRLHAARRGHVKSAMARIECGQCARSIQPHQPIALRTAQGRVGQRLHAAIFPQPIKSLDDRIVGHRLHPHALERFIHLGQRHDVAENQFPLAAGVTGIDDGVDILIADQPQYQLEPAFAFFDGLQFELFRDDRQMLDAPRQLFAVRPLGHFQLHQVTHRRGDDGAVILEITVPVLALLGELAQRFA